jgi:glycosyltransferase involved in cell wall biosynthesis
MLQPRESMNVLFLYNKVFNYRLPIYEKLAHKHKIDVYYTDGFALNSKTVNQYKLKSIKFGPIRIHGMSLFKLAQKYDVVIVFGDIKWLTFSALSFHCDRKYKLFYWTPGVSASYKKRFDEVKRWDWLRDIIYKRSDGLLFYSSYPFEKYVTRGYSREKLHVINNTLFVPRYDISKKATRNSFLFIGTLYKQKGIFDILESYRVQYLANKSLPILNIIGDGPDFKEALEFINSNKLESKIFLLGAIYDDIKKAKYFRKAIAVISPFQAGLGVQESFGYGVPFVTGANAITGGERLDIIHGVNGILLEDAATLRDLFNNLAERQDELYEMGIAGYDFYWKNRTIEIMTRQIDLAIS